VIPAIVLSSHTIGLGVIRALGMMDIPVIVVYYRQDDMGYLSRYVREKIRSPHPEEHEDDFVNLLIELAKRHGGSVLFPVDDATLSAVSRHKALLDKYYMVACTEWSISEQFIDKKHTYALAESIGVPIPKTIIPESAEDVEKYGQMVEYPCVVKPRLGHRYSEAFGKKMVRADNLDQMLIAYREAAGIGVEVMLQELITGDDTHGVNYNSYFWDGKALVEFTAEKVRLAPQGFGVPRVLVSKNIEEVVEPGRKILRAMGFYGYSCTEFKRDSRDGVYKLMEVNGRHNLSTLLSIRCGINFPWLMYKHLVQGELPSACDFKTGIYWIDLTKDLIFSIMDYKKERYSFRQYVTPYLGPHIFAILDLKDIKPFLKRCFDILSGLFRRAAAVLGIRSPEAGKPVRLK